MRLFFVFVLAVAAWPACAAERFATTGEVARPPLGWVVFCRENKGECDKKPVVLRRMPLTWKAWVDLVEVTRTVNEQIKPMEDIEHWGVMEKWSYPDDGFGDCEDYVLEKRRRLVARGWPRETLLIAVVNDKNTQAHAVLIVSTDQGEFILDNSNNAVLPWYATTFLRYRKRQSAEDPNMWVDFTVDPPTGAFKHYVPGAAK